MACHLHLIICTLDAVTTCNPVTIFPFGVWLCLEKRKEKKEYTVHSLALLITITLVLTLTLSLNHLANDLLQTNSPLYGLMYCSATDICELVQSNQNAIFDHVIANLSTYSNTTSSM